MIMHPLHRLFLAAFAAAALSACRAPAPGQDELTLRAQQTLSSSFAIVDAFLAWEYASQPADPEIHAAAETLRRDFPSAHRLAAQLLRAWQASRTPDNRDALDRALKLLAELEDMAREQLKHQLSPQ
jgi:hypothetical protein